MSVSRLMRTLLVTAAVLAYGAPSWAAGEIVWYQDLKRASEVAQRNNLPMFIDFWADWCAACKVMDEDVYKDAGVVKAFEEKIVGVRLHYDLQPDIARRYNVEALPFLAFTNSYGTPLVYHRGFLEAEDLTKVVNAMPALDEINRLDRALQQNKNDFPSLVTLARTLRGAGFYESSSAYYSRALKHGNAKKDPATRESMLYDLGLNWLDLEDGKQAAAALERAMKDFPNSPRRAEMRAALDRAYVLTGKKQ